MVVLRVNLMVTLAYLPLARLLTKACPTSKPCVVQVVQPQQFACDAVVAATVAAAAVFAVPAVTAVAVVALWSSGLVQQKPELKLIPHVLSLRM